MFWVSVKRHDLIEYPSGDEILYFPTTQKKNGKKSSPLTSKQLAPEVNGVFAWGPTLYRDNLPRFPRLFFHVFWVNFLHNKNAKMATGNPQPFEPCTKDA